MEPSRKWMCSTKNLEFLILILLLNSITVKNMKFQVYLHQKRVYYLKANRKLFRKLIEKFFKQSCTFSKSISQVITACLKFSKTAQNRAGRLELV